MGQFFNKSKSGHQSPAPFLRSLSFWGLLIFLGTTSGAALALVFKATPLKNRSTSLADASSLTSLVPTTLNRPVNILVLGIDNAGHAHPGVAPSAEALAGNSDTMLLVRIDPATHRVNILSIPRDTLVQLSGKTDKINDANMQGGVTLAAQSVKQLLGGIPIDRYVRIDTESFVQVVDALGGVEVTVPKPMDYVDKSQHLSIHFLPGRQTLNGQHLQEYVRFRHDEWGDIGRVQRQQEVLKSLLKTLTQPATLGKLPQLLQVIQANVDSDLSIGDLLALSQVLKDVDLHHQINMVMLPGRFSRSDEYPLSYWISDPQATAAVLARYFDPSLPSGSTNPQPIVATPPDQVAIAVENATSQPELADQMIALLKSRGFTNVYLTDHEIDANAAQDTTQIIAQRGNPDVAATVQQAIGSGQVQVAATGDLSSDVTVVIKPDFAAKLHH